MKSIKQQYIDLKEGRISHFNFMRNLRLNFPHLVTNVTSFNDAVKILKNKGILNENLINEDPVGLQAAGNPEDEASLKSSIPGSSIKNDGVNFDEVNDLLANRVALRQLSFEQADMIYDYISANPNKYESQTAIEAVENTIDQLGINNEEDDEDWVDPAGGTHSADEDDPASMYAKELNEGKKKLTKDQVNPVELRMGIRVEMEHTKDPKKAEKIALDHLCENPFYYTALKLSGVENPKIDSKKTTSKEVKGELVDKANQMKTPKGVEKIKASANKAKKETNKLVKGVKSTGTTSKTVRGVKKMDPTGEKTKTVKLKENLDENHLHTKDDQIKYILSSGNYIGSEEELKTKSEEEIKKIYDTVEKIEKDKINFKNPEKYRALQSKISELVKEIFEEMTNK